MIQCDSGHVNGNLIACARYRTYDERVKALKRHRIQSGYGITHILFIINLPHQISTSSFVSFQGHPWICAHIDDLRPTSVDILGSMEGTPLTISQMFIGTNLPGVSLLQRRDTKDESQENLNVNETEIQRNGKEYAACRTARCEQLYTCIQAAVSKLNDTTRERSIQLIKYLTKLIPKTPSHKIEGILFIVAIHGIALKLKFFNNIILTGHHCFYSILVIHIHRLLLERENNQPELSEWILSEALDISKLEVGGTFRNVLARKIDEIVIPVLAKIISCVDRYYNLDHVIPKSTQSELSDFWLSMFREPEIMQLKYYEVVQGDKIPSGKKLGHYGSFKCQMPFFWFISESVESCGDYTKCHTGI